MFPRIEIRTERLLLRPWRLGDVEDAYSYAKDPDWGRYPWRVPQPYTFRDAEEFVTASANDSWQEQAEFAIEFEGHAIGGIRLHVRNAADGQVGLGYGLSRAHWGKGLVVEAAKFLSHLVARRQCLDRGLVRQIPCPTARRLSSPRPRAHAWTTGALTASGWLDWVRALPLEDRFELADGTRVLCVHASHGTDDGTAITPAPTDEEVEHLLQGCEAELVLVGHTHWPLDRTVAGVRIVNPGSVAYPYYPDLLGSYAMIEADASGHHISHHRVEFDIAAVIEAIWANGYFPNPEWLVQRYTNQRLPPWERQSG